LNFAKEWLIQKGKKKMVRRTKPHLILFLSAFLFACTPVISEEMRKEVNLSLTFRQVAQSPDSYKGRIVLWGGRIIQVLPQADGTTLVEVLRWPLDWWDEPRETVSFHGEFLVLFKKTLDPSRYKRGVRITVAGEILGSIQGEKIKSVSDPTYRYPLLLNKQIHVWKYVPYPYSSAPDERETWEYREYEGILRY
jgi:outer membrane lipoprotein